MFRYVHTFIIYQISENLQIFQISHLVSDSAGISDFSDFAIFSELSVCADFLIFRIFRFSDVAVFQMFQMFLIFYIFRFSSLLFDFAEGFQVSCHSH